jgi:o-succinylbenzoate---CoA ligase
MNDLFHPDGNQRFPDWLMRRAESNPERLAVISGSIQYTFADLNKRADLAACWLAGLGVRPGDRIAIHLPNSIAFVELVHALPRCGAILVPINLRLTPEEISWQLNDVQASIVITSDPDHVLSSAIDAGAPATRIVEVDSHCPDWSTNSRPELDLISYHAPDETHSIVYTSGTTGYPKGALLTYGNHWWSALGSGLNLGIHNDDRWIAVLPLFHVGGLSILLRSVIYGITAIVHESFDPERVNRSIDEDRATIISVVSTMLRRMLVAQGDKRYPDWLRCVLLGGGPAPRPLLEACAEKNIPVTQTYGLTESASQLATLPPDDALRKLGSAGKPLYPNELAIRSSDHWAPPGEPGEILVRGPIVTAGYFGRPDATAAALYDGWFRTGDAGYQDDDGYLYVLDRRDDLIVSGGENVYPAEVEAILSGHPDIVEAGVIGVEDEEWGQRVVAVLSCTSTSPDPDEVRHWCRQHLAGYKVPTELQIISEPLPRNAGGKLLRRTLRTDWEHSRITY